MILDSLYCNASLFGYFFIRQAKLPAQDETFFNVFR